MYTFIERNRFTRRQVTGVAVELLRCMHLMSEGYVPGLYLVHTASDEKAPDFFSLVDVLSAAAMLQGSAVDASEAVESAAIAIQKQAGTGDLALRLVADKFSGKPHFVVLLVPGKNIIGDREGEPRLLPAVCHIRTSTILSPVERNGIPELMPTHGTAYGESLKDNPDGPNQILRDQLKRIGDAFVDDWTKFQADKGNLIKPEWVFTGSEHYIKIMNDARGRGASGPGRLLDTPKLGEGERVALAGIFAGLVDAFRGQMGLPENAPIVKIEGTTMEEIFDDATKHAQKLKDGPLFDEATATVALDTPHLVDEAVASAQLSETDAAQTRKPPTAPQDAGVGSSTITE